MKVAFTIALFAVPHNVAWVPKGGRFRSSPTSIPPPRLLTSVVRPNRLMRGFSRLAKDDDSLELHRVVAEQDPEWYREFVSNVLGEEFAEANGKTTQLNGSMKCATPIDKGESKSDRPQSSEVAFSGKESVLPTSSTSDDLVVEEALDMACDTHRNDVTGASMSDDYNNGSARIRDTKSTEGSIFSERSVPRTSRRLSSRGLTSPTSDDKTVNDQQSEIGTTNPTAKVEQTESIELSDPFETGVDTPLASSNTDVVVPRGDAHDTNAEARSQASVGQSRKGTPSADFPGRMYQQQPQARKEATKEADSGVEIGRDHAGYVVLYRDLYTGAPRPVNLTTLIELGYNVTEIPYLQPDALALIVEDEIRKPSRGIPQQWKISRSQYKVLSEDVRIVPQEEAKGLLETLNEKQTENGEDSEARLMPQSGSKTVGEGKPTTEYRSGKMYRERKPASQGRERPSRRNEGGTRQPVKGPSSKQKSSRTRRDTKKRIYSAREIPKSEPEPEQDDPPPPNSPLWVDMNTFRDLLRKEAELRLRVLGEDWADVVKEESNWRLRLYKEWLWTLHKGIGNPVVPSRSDRAQQQRVSTNANKDKRRADAPAPRRRRSPSGGGNYPYDGRTRPVTEARDDAVPSRRTRTAREDDNTKEDAVDPLNRRVSSESVMGDNVQDLTRQGRRPERTVAETDKRAQTKGKVQDRRVEERIRNRSQRQERYYSNADPLTVNGRGQSYRRRRRGRPNPDSPSGRRSRLDENDNEEDGDEGGWIDLSWEGPSSSQQAEDYARERRRRPRDYDVD